ncbi:MAG: hypothetical protein D6714_09155 [Bacteroidetes bacterium]|nr:MAG: hypothetical protein D6714_09155 [Bacteroidota bacterium]
MDFRPKNPLDIPALKKTECLQVFKPLTIGGQKGSKRTQFWVGKYPIFFFGRNPPRQNPKAGNLWPPP